MAGINFKGVSIKINWLGIRDLDTSRHRTRDIACERLCASLKWGRRHNFAMLFYILQLAVLAAAQTKTVLDCGGPFAAPCIPSAPTSSSTANNVECADWEALGWYRTDLRSSIWQERKVDDWLVKFIQDNPSLKSVDTPSTKKPGVLGFYQQLAKLTNHKWTGTCNTYALL
jgi:hypothetical protein